MDHLSEIVRARLENLKVSPQSRSDLLDAGLREHDIRRLVRRGLLQHHHGHYIGTHLRTDLAQIACAQRAFPGTTISHFTAAKIAELRTWVDRKRTAAPDVDAIWLTRPPKRGRVGPADGVVLRHAAMDPRDVRPENRLTITREARTVVDLARQLSLREAVVTIDHALTVSVTRADLDRTLRRQSGWPGIKSARRAIAFGDPRSESALESIARAEFSLNGLPPPVLQASFWKGSGWMAERVDFWWPQFRTFAEADGLAKYESDTPKGRRRLMREAFLREQRLADLPLEMVRFGWEDAVDDAKSLAERLRDAFARGISRAGDVPRWRAADPYDVNLWPKTPPIDETALWIPAS